MGFPPVSLFHPFSPVFTHFSLTHSDLPWENILLVSLSIQVRNLRHVSIFLRPYLDTFEPCINMSIPVHNWVYLSHSLTHDLLCRRPSHGKKRPTFLPAHWFFGNSWVSANRWNASVAAHSLYLFRAKVTACTCQERGINWCWPIGGQDKGRCVPIP